MEFILWIFILAFGSLGLSFVLISALINIYRKES